MNNKTTQPFDSQPLPDAGHPHAARPVIVQENPAEEMRRHKILPFEEPEDPHSPVTAGTLFKVAQKLVIGINMGNEATILVKRGVQNLTAEFAEQKETVEEHEMRLNQGDELLDLVRSVKSALLWLGGTIILILVGAASIILADWANHIHVVHGP